MLEEKKTLDNQDMTEVSGGIVEHHDRNLVSCPFCDAYRTESFEVLRELPDGRKWILCHVCGLEWLAECERFQYIR